MPRWAAAGHVLQVDVTLLGLHAETLVTRRRLLVQIRDEDLSRYSVALEMLREFDEDLAHQRRELMLPEEL